MEDKVAAITGASKGLGAALAKLLGDRGYKLVLGSRNKEEIEKFVKSITNTEVEVVVVDIKKKDDCQRFIKAAVNRFGRIDLLINNAGTFKLASIQEVTEEMLQKMFQTNVFGTMFCSKEAVKIMKNQRSGHILNIGSTSATDYKADHTAYGTSKSAVVGFTGHLRKELEGTGIRVTCFNPGGMRSGLFREHPEIDTKTFMDPGFVAEKIVKHIENPQDEWNIILRRPK